MGDMGEVFNEARKLGQEKRARNRNTSAQLLAEKGISFEEKNDGAHLIVTGSDGLVDFWPGTGLWIDRSTRRRRRGVRSLIQHIGGGSHAAHREGEEDQEEHAQGVREEGGR